MKKLSILTVVLAFLATTSLSFAAQTAGINVTSEPVPAGSICSKAGGFTISFDNGTIFTEGDVITFDLDLNTTLCKNINMVIGNFATATTFTGLNATTVPGNGAVTSTDGLTTDAIAVAGGTDGDTGIYFKLTGVAGTSRVTLSVLGDNAAQTKNDATLTFTADPVNSTNKFILNFLDGTDYLAANAAAAFGVNDDAIYVADTSVAPVTYSLATVAANSLCINVSQTTAATINANFDSASDTYTFVPSNPQVAHIVGANTYLLYESKGRVTDKLLYPSTIQSGCVPFDNETPVGFCTAGTPPAQIHTANQLIVQAPGGFGLDGNVQVTLDILVNGKTGANGVYWGATAVGISADNNASTVVTGPAVGPTAVGPVSALRADGLTAATIDAIQTDCAVADADKGVRLVTIATPSTTLGLATGANAFMYIDMPSFTYDSTEVSIGDVVSVRVSVNLLPCGTIIDAQEWEIGTFGCATSATVRTQRYPYFSKEGAYTNAVIITNVEDNDGTANLVLYEDDGDVFEATVSVKANSLYVNLLGNIAWTANAASTGSKVQGDARSYMEMSATFNCDGAAMITNPSDGQSMGYLPRQ